MFKNISWTNYWEFILITLFVYYTTITCLYYLNDIKQALSGKSDLLSKLSFIKTIHTNTNINLSSNIEAENELPLYVHEYLNETKGIIEYAVKNNLIKQEVLYSLQQLSKKYKQIKDSPFQSFVSNYILNETSNHSSVYLSEEDVNALWNV